MHPISENPALNRMFVSMFKANALADFFSEVSTDCLNREDMQSYRREDVVLILKHYLRECIEVLSWVERRDEDYTLIYYPDKLKESAEYVLKNSKAEEKQEALDGFAPAPERTVHINPAPEILYNSDSLKTFKKTGAETQIAKSQIASKTTKVFIPISYGFRDDCTGANLDALLNKFFKNLIIEPHNVYIFLGPHEPINQPDKQNYWQEQILLYRWLESNMPIVRRYGINIHAYDLSHLPTNLRAKFNDVLEWYSTREFIVAQDLLETMLSKPKHRKQLKSLLIKDASNFLKSEYSALKATQYNLKENDKSAFNNMNYVEKGINDYVKRALEALDNTSTVENKHLTYISYIGLYNLTHSLLQKHLKSRSVISSQLDVIRDSAFKIFIRDLKALNEFCCNNNYIFDEVLEYANIALQSVIFNEDLLPQEKSDLRQKVNLTLTKLYYSYIYTYTNVQLEMIKCAEHGNVVNYTHFIHFYSHLENHYIQSRNKIIASCKPTTQFALKKIRQCALEYVHQQVIAKAAVLCDLGKYRNQLEEFIDTVKKTSLFDNRNSVLSIDSYLILAYLEYFPLLMTTALNQISEKHRRSKSRIDYFDYISLYAELKHFYENYLSSDYLKLLPSLKETIMGWRIEIRGLALAAFKDHANVLTKECIVKRTSFDSVTDFTEEALQTRLFNEHRKPPSFFRPKETSAASKIRLYVSKLEKEYFKELLQVDNIHGRMKSPKRK